MPPVAIQRRRAVSISILWNALLLAVGMCLPSVARAAVPAQAVDQLPGIVATIGKPARLGLVLPFLFTLEKAEFAVEPVDNTRPLKGSEKVLKLTFTIQNALKRDQNLRAYNLEFTAVDDQNVSHQWQRVLRSAASPNTDISMQLKPAQKVTCVASVRVPNGVDVPKLIVRRLSDAKAKVLRYDLRTRIGRVPLPFADPTDQTGKKALDSVPAEAGTFWPMGNWAIRFDSGGAATPDELGLRAPKKGYAYYVAQVTLRNTALRPTAVSSGRLIRSSFAMSADGEKFGAVQQRHAKRPEAFPGESVAPGDSVSLRLVFQLPEGTTPQTLHLCEHYGGIVSRVYVFRP